MYKLFFVAWHNMKKQKGDMITFLLFSILSAYLIFQCASVLLGLQDVMDNRFEEVNGAHVMILAGNSPDETAAWTEAMTENADIDDVETVPFMRMYAEYRNAKTKDFEEYQFLAECFKTNPRYMNMGIDSSNLGDNDVLLPYFLKGRFAVGDTLEIKLGDNVYSFRVAGYVEDPYFSSSINITTYYCYFSQAALDRFVAENPARAGFGTVYRGHVKQASLDAGLNTKTTEKEVTESFFRKITPYMEANPDYDYNNYFSVNWHMISGGTKFLPQVVMAVVLMFAVLILVIAFVIISHGVRNFITRNMKNTGILEAAGYTASMLRMALVVQITAVAYIGAKIGVGLAILTRNTFGNLVSAVLGLTWNAPISWGVALATIYGFAVVTFLLSMLIGRAYKKITVLDALRGGISTHNYKKNYVPLDKTSLPLSVAMSLKSTLGGMRRSILLAVIAAVLAIAMTCGFGMYESFGAREDSLIEIMGMEAGTVYITKADISYVDELRNMDGVTNVLLQKGFEPTIMFGDKEQGAYVYVDDDVNHRVNLMLLEGRVPVHDNEILLTKALAEDLGAGIGDVVTIKNGTKTMEYIVTGFDQRMERMGRTANLTIPGAEKIFGPITKMDVIISVKDGITFDDMKDKVTEIAKAHDNSDIVLVDSEKNMHSTMGTVATAMKILCVVIAVITLMIVVFTESLIIRAKITREWRDMGISKALGATSGQLILQIMLSNLPAVLLGSLIGVAVSDWAGGALCKAIFSLFGLKKINFSTPICWMVLTAAGILLMAALSSAVMGLRVRSMKPVEMITEE